MAIALDSLEPGFRTRVRELLERCRVRGVEMRPYAGLRDTFEQARLWRQSRSIEEINEKIRTLREHGAPFLAMCIESVGSQHGDHVTNTPPGLSWHQWGEALDCFWVVDGRAEWSTRRRIDGVNGYSIYAEEAEKIGLTAGGRWIRFKDWPHVQARSDGSVESAIPIRTIDAEMRRRFSG